MTTDTTDDGAVDAAASRGQKRLEATTGPERAAYAHWDSLQTRWMDNDMYGHINNVQYYSYFDTVIARWLMHHAGLDLYSSDVIGLCVESGCSFSGPLGFPSDVEAGLRVGRMGTTSVRFELALFNAGDQSPAATGHFVHVYVDRATRRPIQPPSQLRQALAALSGLPSR